MHLNAISVLQFKNYLQSGFRFEERIVGISGKNGVGKTNLLDAIYYCCFTRSYFTKADAQNVFSGLQGFRVEADFTLQERPQQVTCIVRETGKKEISLNNEIYSRFSDHIGKFPCVMIAPDDVQIITGGSEDRRQFLDTLLCQWDHSYLVQLISYTRVLQQRNSLLKSFAENRRTDEGLLQVLDQQLSQPGKFIYEKRKQFSGDFIPLVKQLYSQISGENYPVELQYESQLDQSGYEELLLRFREKDLYLQRSNGGIHKDELSITLHGQLFKQVASQGQRKSMLFALKLASFQVLKQVNGFAPILLLDDVFEKLDEQRMHNLLQWVCKENDGQLFITDTHPERITYHLDSFSSPQFILLS